MSCVRDTCISLLDKLGISKQTRQRNEMGKAYAAGFMTALNEVLQLSDLPEEEAEVKLDILIKQTSYVVTTPEVLALFPDILDHRTLRQMNKDKS